MKEFISIFQIMIASLLVATILLQSRGAGLGSAWGGGGEFYRSRRGVEKILQKTTIILAVLFLFSSIIQAII